MATRECHFTDGLYQEGHQECSRCFYKVRSVCKTFSIYNGIREHEYYLTPPEEDPINVESSVATLTDRIKKVRKRW